MTQCLLFHTSTMKNTNQKSSPTTFDVHTMQSDNATRKTAPKQTQQLPQNTPLRATPAPAQSSEPNPFLSDTPTSEADGIGKNTFAPSQSDGPEKINYEISDITADLKNPELPQEKGASPGRKIIVITITVLLILFVAGGVYYYIFLKPTDSTPSDAVETPPAIELPTTPAVTIPEPSTYSLDMPNYFTIDINNPSVATDITTQLSTIRTELPQQSPTKPIIFIVTDTASAPVSFHQFTIAAQLGLTEDILSVLDRNFELYAHADPTLGIRFGLVVNTKDPITLQSTLAMHEQLLPQALSLFLPSDTVSAHPIIFRDNVYYNKPLRYANLNEEETYSIDYAVFNNQWLVGTSKDTLRTIFDTLHEKTAYQEPSPDFTY